MMIRTLERVRIAALIAMLSASAAAALPPPTPEQAQAAAAKKAQADAQAEKEKQELAASMDAIAARWRERAKANGWPVHPPTPVATKGLDAPATQSSSSAQPGGKLGSAAREAPRLSEKSGTAPPSKDVKKKPAGAKQ
jgi:type II secretory pathway pseudopilin PulG